MTTSPRVLEFDRLVEELRLRSSNHQSTLDLLARLEIGAVRMSPASAAKIRQFLQYLPRTGHHFTFIHRYTAYYLLSHATLKSADRSRLEAGRDLVRELRKHAERPVPKPPLWPPAQQPETPGTPEVEVTLTDEAVLTTAETFLEALERLRRTFGEVKALRDTWPATAADEGSAAGSAPPTTPRTQPTKTSKKSKSTPPPPPPSDLRDNGVIGLRRQVLAQLDHANEEVRMLLNCRSVAEILHELCQLALAWFHNTLQYEHYAAAEDTLLDRLLHMIFFYTHFKGCNGHLPEAFADLLRDHPNACQAFCVPDLDAHQQPGAEYVRDASYKIFSGRLSGSDDARFVFPLVSPRPDVLRHLTVTRLFLHPGLVYRLLNPTATDLREHRADLQLALDFCERVSDTLFISSSSGSKPKRATLRSLTERVAELVTLGLSAPSSAQYAQLAIMRSWALPPAAAAGVAPTDELAAELAQQLILIIYNSYMFYTCLESFNPTFLFQNKKRLLLEQQRAVLVGPHEHLRLIWQNVLLNLNRFFHVWFSEEEFRVQCYGLSAAERQYLYRDLNNKWGDLLFSPPVATTTTSDAPGAVPDAGAAAPADLQPADILQSCVAVREATAAATEGRRVAAYDTLSPMTVHPDFPEIFADAVALPEFQAVLQMSSAVFRETGHARLLELIYACQVLLPRQPLLYHQLVALYNLLYFVRDLDLGTFKTIHQLAVSTYTILSSLARQPPSRSVPLLCDLTKQSLLLNVRRTMNPVLDDLLRHHARTIQAYVEQTRSCHAVAACEAYVQYAPPRVALFVRGRAVGALSLGEFLDACQAFVDSTGGLHDRLELLHGNLEQMRRRTQHLIEDLHAIHEYADDRGVFRDIRNASRQLLQRVATVEARFAATVQAARRSNEIVLSSLRRILATFQSLDTPQLSAQGVAECLAEAKKFVHASVALTRPEPPGPDADLREIRQTLKRLFLRGEGATTEQTAPFKHMSAEVDTPLPPYPRLTDGPYLVLSDPGWRGWYLGETPRTANDLLGPFLRPPTPPPGTPTTPEPTPDRPPETAPAPP
ncbi:T47 [Tupaiid betaherpesvirus 1]|uniref:T47 n=1 Tax=Tupaiid herpesvirus 1 (strain 1) TaxID=10397 RepID=Q91TP2_TUHV1|nr:T47 [Tupaiid betaherpesvirus 1]AAK57095.1 T47 [Tupaiid betaherpesvirus 1]